MIVVGLVSEMGGWENEAKFNKLLESYSKTGRHLTSFDGSIINTSKLSAGIEHLRNKIELLWCTRTEYLMPRPFIWKVFYHYLEGFRELSPVISYEDLKTCGTSLGIVVFLS